MKCFSDKDMDADFSLDVHAAQIHIVIAFGCDPRTENMACRLAADAAMRGHFVDFLETCHVPPYLGRND